MIYSYTSLSNKSNVNEQNMNIIKSDGMYDFRNVHFTNIEIDILSKLMDEAIRDNKFDSLTLVRLQKGFNSLKCNNSYHGLIESF